jgi:heme oxygenase
MDVRAELRAATGPHHTRIEQLPVAAAMLAGTIDRGAYARLLRGLYHLHAAFEAGLAAEPGAAAVWPRTPSRAAALERDLRAFGMPPGGEDPAVGAWAADVAACGHPAAWAGAGYVFEGARMGSRVLARSLARGFGLEPRLGVGLDYHLDAGPDPAGDWTRVLGALAELGREPDARRAAVAAAVRTFEALHAIHETAAGRAVLESVG